MTRYPPVTLSSIELTFANHTYKFRRLTWVEEITFSQEHPGGSRQTYAAYAMTSIDTKHLTFEQADAILKALPRAVADRVITYYYGMLPTRRVPTATRPYVAPAPLAFSRQVADAEDSEERAEVEAAERMFGKEEVADAMALEKKMLVGTNAKPLPTHPEDVDGGPDVEVEVW